MPRDMPIDYLNKPTRSKYYNKSVIIDDHRFASRKEARRYQTLKLLQKNGNIRGLELQPRFLLQEGFEKDNVKYRPIYYVADFQYFDFMKKRITIEDVKGFKKNRVFLLKQKMFEYNYPALKLVLV